MDPRDFDVLFPDIDGEKLRSEIPAIVGKQYHAKATKDEANHVVKAGIGFNYGRAHRTLFPCVVSYEGKSHWIVFIVDTGAPLTYLSVQVSAPNRKNAWPLIWF